MTPEDMADLHGQSFARGWSAKSFADLCADPNTCVAARAEGFAIARRVLDEAELLTIVVAKEARAKGIGRQLLDRLLGDLAALGVAHIHLEVAADNAAARTLYDRLGFAVVGHRKAYYPRPDGAVDALLMCKSRYDGC